MADSPSDGDVLITSTAKGHFISVVPYPHRLSFSTFPAAIQLATRWAAANHAAVWHVVDGSVYQLHVDATPDHQQL